MLDSMYRTLLQGFHYFRNSVITPLHKVTQYVNNKWFIGANIMNSYYNSIITWRLSLPVSDKLYRFQTATFNYDFFFISFLFFLFFFLVICSFSTPSKKRIHFSYKIGLSQGNRVKENFVLFHLTRLAFDIINTTDEIKVKNSLLLKGKYIWSYFVLTHYIFFSIINGILIFGIIL